MNIDLDRITNAIYEIGHCDDCPLWCKFSEQCKHPDRPFEKADFIKQIDYLNHCPLKNEMTIFKYCNNKRINTNQ